MGEWKCGQDGRKCGKDGKHILIIFLVPISCIYRLIGLSQALKWDVVNIVEVCVSVRAEGALYDIDSESQVVHCVPGTPPPLSSSGSLLEQPL
jgi:hypothetical protein